MSVERLVYTTEWYDTLVSDCKAIIDLAKIETGIRLLRAKWELGNRILPDYHRFGSYSGGKTLQEFANDLGTCHQRASEWIRFREMVGEDFEKWFADRSANLPTWKEIVREWLPKKRRGEPNTLVKRKFDVWNIANIDLEKPFGDPAYPGSIPGDIVANVLMWFLPHGGKVVDPMAGGGVTEDVCRALGSKYQVLLYDSKRLKNYQYRDSVRFNDIERGKLPKEAYDADIIFVDPPYGPLKDYGAEPEKLESVLRGLAKASYEALKNDGLVAVLMQNYYTDGECVGTFIPLVRRTAEIFESSKSPKRFHQIFEGTVPLHGKVARSQDHMTHIDRRLMVFKVDKSL